MTVVAFLLIFVSVFLHVTWNMLSKGTTPSPAFYSLMSFTAAAIWLPFFAVSDISLTQMPLNFYLLAAGSIAGEIIYMTGLAYGYKKSDISLVYPVVRALPVMMIALITTIFGLGRKLEIWHYVGMLLISCGCFLMPLTSLKNFSFKAYCSSVLVFILLGIFPPEDGTFRHICRFGPSARHGSRPRRGHRCQTYKCGRPCGWSKDGGK